MKRILFLGDSNTFGYDPRNYMSGRYPPDVRWTDRLRRPDREVRNLGQNGLRILRPGEFPALGELLDRNAPFDAAAVMLGTNDLLSGVSAGQAAESMKALLGYLLSVMPGAAWILTAPPPLAEGEWVDDPAQIAESRLLAEAYRRLAAGLGILFADAGAWDVALCYDGVHFSPAGHAAFARGMDAFLNAAAL